MKLPSIQLRGEVWYADLRPWGGQRNSALGLSASATQLEVGMALQRRLDGLRMGARIAEPTLPGLEGEGRLFGSLASDFAEDHEAATKAGRLYVRRYTSKIREDLGKLPVTAFVAPQGREVLKTWRDLLWSRGLANSTVKNYLAMVKAILVWGQSDGRELTGAIPKFPKAVRDGEVLRRPIYDSWSEADFRVLRERFADAPLAQGRLRGYGDPLAWIARRKLWLSVAFYTGMHAADVSAVRGEWLNVNMGRYWRHNTKSARAVSPAPFDMPEQFRLDCEEELRRIGREWRPEEVVTGGPWTHTTRILGRAVKRLFPEGGRCPFNTKVARRSTVREYTLRGWRVPEIAAVLGHVDDEMVRRIYQQCTELGLVSEVRVPWTCASGPGGRPTSTGRVLRMRAV